MTNLRTLFLFAAIVVFSTTLSGTAQAENDCPEFSKVVWWETSHEKIIAYVSRKHGGDWTPYVEKWGRQLEKMKSLHKRGGAAVFKSNDLRLEGAALEQYIGAIAERLAVTQCLAHREIANAVDKKTNTGNDG